MKELEVIHYYRFNKLSMSTVRHYFYIPSIDTLIPCISMLDGGKLNTIIHPCDPTSQNAEEAKIWKQEIVSSLTDHSIRDYLAPCCIVKSKKFNYSETKIYEFLMTLRHLELYKQKKERWTKPFEVSYIQEEVNRNLAALLQAAS